MTRPGVATRRLDAASGVLAGEISGDGDRLVLVHGFSQTGRSWRRIAAHLAARHEVLCVDLPDHGRSGDVHARDLSAAARALGNTAGRGTYVGYSLGGRVCLTLALEVPSLVERLVLVGASPGIPTAEARAERRRVDEALADRLDGSDGSGGMSLADFLAEWLAGPLFAHLGAHEADLGARRANTPAGLAASLRTLGAGTQEPALARLGELAMPVLVLAGAEDPRYRDLAAEMAEAIGENATCALIARAGHAAPFEQPRRFLAVLAGWLEATR